MDFLLAGRRVELNAFASRDLVEWLEEQLKKHGVKKVLPTEDVLSEAYRRAFVRQSVRSAIPELSAQAERRLADEGVPKDLDRLVANRLAKKPAEPWDRAVAHLARKAARSHSP